jgi:hypothetical protein
MDFTSLRLGQLPTEVISLTDNIAHEVGTDLKVRYKSLLI